MTATLALLFALALPESVLPDWDGGAPPALPTRLIARDGVLLLGTDAGLYQRGASGWRLVLARDGVRDLSAGGAGAIVATAAGLYEWQASDGDTRELRLGAGAEPFGVAVDATGAAWIATAAGLFRREPGAREFARAAGLPPGEVRAVASAGDELWVATEGALFRRDAEARFTQRLSGLEPGWFELCGAVSAGEVTLLCVPEGVWRVAGDELRRVGLGVGRVYALAHAGGRIFAAAEAGLYAWDEGAAGRGAGRQELSVPARGLAQQGETLFVATEQGVARFAVGPTPAPAPASTGTPRSRVVALARPEARASQVAQLQRAVLAYLELSPARIRDLETKAKRTGLWPELRASLFYDRDWSRGVDHDEVFTSGEQRRLRDFGNERAQNYQAGLSFVWDLSELASPDDALAISRERRSLVTLRDQVLERVNHLYFQRLRVLAQLEALGPGDAERAALELDAAELGAQLDAWSGGTFSRLDPTSPLEPEREP